MEDKIKNLERLDHRLHKEMVSKPYHYIDKVKAELMKEQSAIVDIVKKNNDKYISRIA